MDYMPVFLQLRNVSCLVVGGGAIAERKVRLLVRAGANVTVIGRNLTVGLGELREKGRILHQVGKFAGRSLAGMRLVIAATDSDEVNERVSRTSEAAGIFCNVVDNGAASSFIVPAIVDRSPVIVAISTGGKAPVLAQRLKSQIAAWLPARIGALATQAGRWRKLVKKRYASMQERRRFWQRFFDGPIADHLLANRRRAAERALRLELIENVVPHTHPVGEAYIVGGGPGDPGLVTIRAQQLISRADVVLYDRLTSDEILDLARKDAEFVSVGKNVGAATNSQVEINELIIAHVKAGKRVCRLKGGDPFVFGRGGEEAQALAAAGLPYQIVPGVSAALACAAYAGIPLTHRGISSSVTFATAKRDGDIPPDWAAIVRSGQTLALYMSVGSVVTTVQQLIKHGLGVATPAAVVENGASDRQRVLHATLASIADDAIAANVRAPAILFVGETVRLGKKLGWFSGNAATSKCEFVDRKSLSSSGLPGSLRSLKSPRRLQG